MSNIFAEGDLDLSFLYEIADGNTEFICESIDMFLQHSPVMVQTITTAINEKNWTEVMATAHKLKSNLGFFGMSISQSIIQEVELMAKTSIPDQELITSKFNEAKQMISVNLVKLTEIRASL